jgi:hypothetical protein
MHGVDDPEETAAFREFADGPVEWNAPLDDFAAAPSFERWREPMRFVARHRPPRPPEYRGRPDLP